MLVDILVKNITDQYLDEYTSKHIYGPLGLKHTTFKPMEHGFSSSDTAATELVGNTRQRQILPSDNFPDIRVTTIQGEVHDEDSYYCMNGVSGHAGLFSTAHDLTVLSQLMLNGGEFQNIRLFNQDIIDLVSQPIPDPQSETKCQFGVGWKVNADQDTNNFIFGNSAPFQAYGHNG
jgi:CubicO group peptidase (beta-lactamase class C family)